MSVELRAYINFEGTTREAMEYYQSVFGGELMVTTFGEAHAQPADSPSATKVMNSQLSTDLFTLMAADIIEETPFEVRVGNNFNLALVGDSAADLEAIAPRFEALAKDANPDTYMPLSRVMWGDVFGGLQDRFGVSWMVNVSVPEGEAGPYERPFEM
ncbi:MAG: VOC family protein [Dermabacter sp.]|nr:VOC family protein [Dermabacter sp.]